MDLPNLESLPFVDDLAWNEAVALFVRRAQAICPDFVLNQSNARAVAEICVRLDGLPLAIELAAARLRLLPEPAALLARLEPRLLQLVGGRRDAPPRQQTMRDAIAWSYDLLSADEQTLFRGMGVLVGGGTLEAAEAVAGATVPLGESILTGLGALVEASLLRVGAGQDGQPRFYMLQTIREFGLEELRSNGEDTRTRRAFAEFFCGLSQEAEPHILGANQGPWLDRLQEELDNLRAALGWTLDEGFAEAGIRFAGALGRFWEVRGYLTEGRKWVEQALALRGDVSDLTQASVLDVAGILAMTQGDLDRAEVSHERALTIRRESGDATSIARSLNNIGITAQRRGDYSRAAILYRESLEMKRALGDPGDIASTLNNLAHVEAQIGDVDQAIEYARESRALAESVGDVSGVASAYGNEGLIEQRRRNYSPATALLNEALRLYRQLGYKWGVANTLAMLATGAAERNELSLAASLYSEALILFRELDDKHSSAMAERNLGGIAMTRGDFAIAKDHLSRSIALAESTGSRREIGRSWAVLGGLALHEGDLARACGCYETALRFLSEPGDLRENAVILGNLAAAVSASDVRRAVELYGGAAKLRIDVGVELSESDQRWHGSLLEEMREQLGEEDFESVWAIGQSMEIRALLNRVLEIEC